MEIEIRPVAGVDELARWAAVRNAVLPDDPESVHQLVLVRATELDHVDLIAYADGEPVGAGKLAGDPVSRDSPEPYVEVTVLPEHRRRGVGSMLAHELSALARRLGKTRLRCEARSHDVASIAFLERRGFVEIGRLEQLALDLRSVEVSEGEPPEGVTFTRLVDRPDLIAGMYEVASRTYPELESHVARQAESFLDWQVYELGDDSLLLDLTPIAVAGEEVVGYATMIGLPSGDAALLRTVAVAPGWRRRHVALGLVRRQFAAAKQSGLREVLVWPRSDAVANMCAKLPFRPKTETIAFRGPLLDR